MANQKKLLRALAGEVLDTPPIWMMRQAGRYLASKCLDSASHNGVR